MIVVPFMSLVPAVFIAHLVVGPIGWAIGNAIAEAVNWGLSSDVPRALCRRLWCRLRAARHDRACTT